MRQPSPGVVATVLAAAVAALVAFSKRPVRPPDTKGEWRPAARHPSHR